MTEDRKDGEAGTRRQSAGRKSRRPAGREPENRKSVNRKHSNRKRTEKKPAGRKRTTEEIRTRRRTFGQWGAFLANLALTVCGITVFLRCLCTEGPQTLLTFTTDSGLYTCVGSAAYVWMALRARFGGKRSARRQPAAVRRLRYGSTCCGATALVMLALVIIPAIGAENTGRVLRSDGTLYFGLIAPCISLISFLLWEHRPLVQGRDMLWAMIPTAAYMLALDFLNVIRAVDGPYSVFQVYRQSAAAVVYWIFIVLVLTLLFSWLIRWMNRILSLERGQW